MLLISWKIIFLNFWIFIMKGVENLVKNLIIYVVACSVTVANSKLVMEGNWKLHVQNSKKKHNVARCCYEWNEIPAVSATLGRINPKTRNAIWWYFWWNDWNKGKRCSDEHPKVLNDIFFIVLKPISTLVELIFKKKKNNNEQFIFSLLYINTVYNYI